MNILKLAAAIIVAALAWPMASMAQGGGERRGVGGGDFDFFVLALSWTPGYCAAGGGDEKGRDECKAGSRRGFTVHGLWPQYQQGFPTECTPANRNPSRIALAASADVFPSEGLARYQWRKHGTCSGMSPSDYFAAVKAARERIVIPAGLTDPTADQTFAPIDLERAFAAANQGLRPDMMSVACRGNVLQEVRICLSRDLRSFTPCPEVNRRGCRVRELSVPALR